ncbi:MAG: fibronectin type III domain-containing protein, partial [Usitatibacteraceae bacterium]
MTYSSSNTAVCTVTGGTTLNLVGGGICTITATKALDPNYNVTSDTIGVTVNKASQTALSALINGSAANPSFNYQLPNGTATLSTSGGSGIGAVTYSSSNSVVCSLLGTTLTLASAGTCTITATKATDTNYLLATDVIAVTVNSTASGAPTGISGSAGDQQVTVNFTAPAAPPLSYTASCSAAGQTTRTKIGAASPLIVGGVGNPMTNAVTYACSVTATNANLQVSAPSGTVMLTPSATPVAPAFTSANSANFPVLTAGTTFTVTASGFPVPTITLLSGTLPTGMSFAGGAGAGVLSGTPASGQAGNRVLSFQAQSSSGTVVQSFTLRVLKLTQSISFNPPAFQEFSPGDLSLVATATLAPITFDTTSPSVCSVTGATFRTLALADCTLVAYQAGNIDYDPTDSGKKFVTIIQGSQTINFPPQADKSYSPAGVFALSPPATASSQLDVSYSSLTPSVCFLVDGSLPAITIASVGVCTIRATQKGDDNYSGATEAVRDINIIAANQSITWGAQANQPFGVGGTFAINPLATGGASGNPIMYGSNTPSVCTVAGTTVTKVSVGLCTLTADQAGNGNYNAAPQKSSPLNITASVPSAPTATLLTASDAQIVIEFDPPANNGGSSITGYTAECTPGGNVANGAASPIKVTGLTNNSVYSCAVAAQNAAGNSPLSNVLMATPLLATGSTLWTNNCVACHGATPAGVRFNAAGQTANVLAYVRTAQPAMLAAAEVQALTLNELAEISKYIATFVPPISTNTPFNTPANIDVASHITLGTVTFEGAEVVDAPLHGTLSIFSGTQIVYTPTPGYTGPDSFTYRGFRNTPILKGDKRTVTITVAAPPAPVITSPAIAAGMFGTPFAYQITATNSPISFAAAPLGVNFTIDTTNGLVSGTPSVTGAFVVTVSATNAGGIGTQDVAVTISKASQTITFGAQPGRPFVPGGTFPLAPVASVNSPLTISYSSLAPTVCTISGTTVTILTAGVCLIAADQAGNANYNAALQVSQSINISATAPAAPTIGAATGGDTVAAIAFTPPASNGGSAITGYTATCSPSGSGSGGASPITVSGLTNGVTYTCSVTATNAINTGPASGTVIVTPTATPVAPQITSANATTFTVGALGTFLVTATGTPNPTLALAGTLPTGVTFTPATGALAGTPALG